MGITAHPGFKSLVQWELLHTLALKALFNGNYCTPWLYKPCSMGITVHPGFKSLVQWELLYTLALKALFNGNYCTPWL